jgi:predicted O-methyltransferase YrrM
MHRWLQKIIRSVSMESASARAEFGRKRKALALRAELFRRAQARSADYIEQHMGSALYCKDRLEHLTCATRELPAEGSMLEFGVYGGTSINHLARLFPNRALHGFDSFEGLPEDWSGNRYSTENFNLDGIMPKVAPNVTLVAGWFDNTLPAFLAKNPGPVALAHVDCDIYSSTKTVLELIAPRLVKGSIIVFDEFFNYPNYQHHEIKAFEEFVAKYSVSYQFIAFSGEQVSLRILDIKAAV